MTMMSSFRTVEKRIRYNGVIDTAAALDEGGNAVVQEAQAGERYRVREIFLVGGGTNFAAGGNRTIVLTDGTTVYTTIANADIEAAPANSLRWCDAKVPCPTSVVSTATVAGASLRFEYAGGTTDHSTGSISFIVGVSKIAP